MNAYLEALARAREHATAPTYEQQMQARCDAYNARVGDLHGYDCPHCRNKGQVAYIKNGYELYADCRCMRVRKMLKRLEESGLKDLVGRYTLKTYLATQAWQQKALEEAKRFLQDTGGAWFFIGGQSGSGKTHLCTGIAVQMIKAGMDVRYMLWRDAAVKLKALTTKDDAYLEEISKYKDVEVLYIDDFFKTEQGKSPTTGDIHLAFEILNHRYNDAGKVTLLSSELFLEEIEGVDVALAGRILERAGGYCLHINRDPERNQRMKGCVRNGDR